jgi:LDH2 family malate/lactate/ureidoglycolate dehydrogenase
VTRLSYKIVSVDWRALHVQILGILTAEKVPRNDADYVAWHLVETNLRGTDSHGVARLPHYVRRLRAGSINAVPCIRFEQTAPATGMLDGGNGLGHLVMRHAVDGAASLARASGAGWVAIRNSSHCGALAPLGLRLAEQGMVGFLFTHVDPMVLPHGASEPFCGTNPICITAQGGEGKTLCLDMATSIVPWNVVANAQMEGAPIPGGWAVGSDGHETTDAQAVTALHPFGGYKGSGLGIMIDMLCALLSGAPFGPDIPKMYGDLTRHRRLGGLVGAIDIAAFSSLDLFSRRVAEMATRIGQLRPADGIDKVRFPGEPELEMKARRQVEGIPLGLNLLAELNALAAEAGVLSLVPISVTEVSDVKT